MQPYRPFSSMKNLLVLLVLLLTTVTKLLELGGSRSVVTDTNHHLLSLATRKATHCARQSLAKKHNSPSLNTNVMKVVNDWQHSRQRLPHWNQLL